MAQRNPVKKCPDCSWGKCGMSKGIKYCSMCGWSSKPRKESETVKTKKG